MDPQSRHYRSLRFRYCVSDDRRQEVEATLTGLVDHHDCAISNFRLYDTVAGLGNERHLEEPRTAERQHERAQLVVQNYHSIAKLVLHALVGPDSNGRFCLPHHQNPDPAQETPFRVLHHIFCNATDVPLYVVTASHVPGGPLNPLQHSLQYDRVRF